MANSAIKEVESKITNAADSILKGLCSVIPSGGVFDVFCAVVEPVCPKGDKLIEEDLSIPVEVVDISNTEIGSIFDSVVSNLGLHKKEDEVEDSSLSSSQQSCK